MRSKSDWSLQSSAASSAFILAGAPLPALPSEMLGEEKPLDVRSHFSLSLSICCFTCGDSILSGGGLQCTEDVPAVFAGMEHKPSCAPSPFPSPLPDNCSCSAISAKVAGSPWVTSAVMYLWAAPVVAGSPHKHWPAVVTSTNHIIFHLGTSRLVLRICRTRGPVLTPAQ